MRKLPEYDPDTVWEAQAKEFPILDMFKRAGFHEINIYMGAPEGDSIKTPEGSTSETRYDVTFYLRQRRHLISLLPEIENGLRQLFTKVQEHLSISQRTSRKRTAIDITESSEEYADIPLSGSLASAACILWEANVSGLVITARGKQEQISLIISTDREPSMLTIKRDKILLVEKIISRFGIQNLGC